MMSGQPNILYEDNHLLVVEKPPGMLVQEDHSGEMDLLRTLKQYLKVKYDKPGEVFLGMVHRLDRNVGGVMVFARTTKAASRLSEQIRHRTLDKVYLAVLQNAPAEPEDTLVHYLRKDEKTNTVEVVGEDHPEGKRAVLHYRVLETGLRGSLVEINLETGRPHQIRVQFAAIGCPLRGDRKYGGPAAGPERSVALWAYQLGLDHPTRKDRIIFRALPPAGGVWSFAWLENLRKGTKVVQCAERSQDDAQKDQS